MRIRNRIALGLLWAAGLWVAAPAALASSHSEAPGTAKDRLIDDTDLYAFVSPDAKGTVTIIGNWIPLLEPNGGPNFYAFDDQAAYYMNIDNVGDAQAHVRYQFTFVTEVVNGNTFLYNTGPVHQIGDATLNVKQFYTVTRYDDGVPAVLGTRLQVAPNNVGPASMPDYERLAEQAVHRLSDGSKVFVGPRDDPFFVDLGAIFDLLTIRKVPGDKGKGRDGVAGFNVMTIAMQIPMERLTRDGNPPDKKGSVIGIWDTAERPANRTLNADGTVSVSGPGMQVSRLGMPLVNEVVIPRAMKDKFNASKPANDGQFLSFVLDPELAGLLNALYGLPVPPAPRNDLVAVFLTGVPGLNQPDNVTPAEMLRLNMSIPAAKKERRLGVLAGDVAGFPNGRRLGDDVVDIAERVVAGVLVPGFDVPLNNRLGDGVDWNDRPFLPHFPYVAPPWSGFSSPHAKKAKKPRHDDKGAAEEDPDSEDGYDEQEISDAAVAEEEGLSFAGRHPSAAPDLRYSLDRAGRVSLRVFDVQGRLVRTLIDQDAAAGTFQTRWDGRTDDGSPAGRGIYFVRFATDGKVADTKKVVLE